MSIPVHVMYLCITLLLPYFSKYGAKLPDLTMLSLMKIHCALVRRIGHLALFSFVGGEGGKKEVGHTHHTQGRTYS